MSHSLSQQFSQESDAGLGSISEGEESHGTRKSSGSAAGSAAAVVSPTAAASEAVAEAAVASPGNVAQVTADVSE